MKRSLIFLALIGLLLAACSAAGNTASGSDIVKTDKGQYTNITPTQLQSMLQNKDFTFINVHTPFEGKIAGTDKLIAYDTIEQHLDQIPADKNAKIVLYCRSGNMSDIAARKLIDLGYKNLYNLQGGFNAWKAAGLPLETQPN